MSKGVKSKGTLLVAAIADATTMTGFLLTGMGERNHKGQQNFLIVDKEMSDSDIEQAFRKMLDREDIGVIFISQNIAERVRNIIVEHEKIVPTILEIPSKDTPYEPEKDTIVLRAATILWGSDTGVEKLKEMSGNKAS